MPQYLDSWLWRREPAACAPPEPEPEPEQAPPLRQRAMLAIEAGDWQTARKLEAQLSSNGENTSELAYNIAVLQQRAGQPAKAVLNYRRALEQTPHFPEALLNLGHAFKTLERHADAQSVWLAALQAQPDLAADYFKPWLEPASPPHDSAGTTDK